MQKTQRAIGDYFVLSYTGKGRDRRAVVSDSFRTEDEALSYIRANRIRRYVLKQQASLPGGGSDGQVYIESTL